MSQPKPPAVIALEFFSGIGGLHYGLEKACRELGCDARVLASFDMNQQANKVYQHNFQQEPINQGIERLSVPYLKSLEKPKKEKTKKRKRVPDSEPLAAVSPRTQEDLPASPVNCWLLSPPCQPYTAGGKRLDDSDLRAAGLLHLISILPLIDTPPRFLFLENVPNFELSQSRGRLLAALNQVGYQIDEFLVSPLAFGIPNDRKRYYLAAHLPAEKPPPYPADDLSLIHTLPSTYCRSVPPDVPLEPLAAYIEEYGPEQLDALWVKETDIRKRTNFIFDVVQPTSHKTSTFTKAYGTHHFFGSGSFLQTQDLDHPYVDDAEHLIRSAPRFFSPTEVARLHAFPLKDDVAGRPRDHWLEFPPDITMKQRWALLGNSLNGLWTLLTIVCVVAALLKELFQRGQ
ncbi:C-5 cytosine-specific DNA methylase [Kappamyces sp. JEL0829]|nr:C-5 cytosine-specific DNA methylase [Kappamyces sp. JEL0829]